MEPIFNSDEIEQYLERVFLGLITMSNLDERLYYRTANQILNSASQAFNASDLISFTRESELFEQFTDNVYRFSAAKQYQQVRQMSTMITQSRDNAVAEFAKFRQKAEVIFDEYNVNYLKTEVATATSQSQNALEFVRFEEQADDFPFLRYETQRDDRVRDEHKNLDGIVKRVDDPFWNDYMPANGWNCRCFVTPLESAEVTPDYDITITDDDVEKDFRFNPARTGYIFHEERHPYFSVKRGHKRLKENNFNLPLPNLEPAI